MKNNILHKLKTDTLLVEELYMRIASSGNGYTPVPNEEAGIDGGVPIPTEDTLMPPNPPEYNIITDLETSDENSNFIEQMEVESSVTEEALVEKMYRFRDSFSNNVIIPMREKIMDPLAQILGMISDKIDFYLNKIGNPLILRRFFYIFMMSAVTYMVMSSGLLPNERSTGSRGMFADHDILLQYAKRSVDLSKMERDLEYLSGMPHMSGTKGDSAIRNYIEESFNNNRLKLVRENEYAAYSNYPGNVSLIASKGSENIIIDVNQENFNPLCANGDLKDVDLIYGHNGTSDEMRELKENGLLENDFVLLIHYGPVVSEQILLAEKYNAKGVLFITDPYGDDKDMVQKKSVGLPQYWTGDALTPGWVYGSMIPQIDPKSSKSLPHIPSLPLSWSQSQKLLSLLSEDGVDFKKAHSSGKPGDVRVDMKVETAVRERHPTHDILGKIRGREQNDKAIIIAASRTAVGNGASYPDYGTAMLLSLLQLFQELKYKFDWKPLRNIYFVSFGGTEFNFAGATELVESRLVMLKDEVYAVLDISKLGINATEKKLDIQSHPLMHEFFNSEDDKMGFDVSVRHVQQYGDWTPFMANGIPISVFSSPDIINLQPPTETSKDLFENVSKLLQDESKREMASDLLLYVFQAALKLVDKPLLPFNIGTYVHVIDELLQDISRKHNNELHFENIIKALLLWKNIGEEWSAWNKGWENIVFSRDEGLEPSLLSVHRWTWNRKLANIGRRQCSPAGLPNRPFYKNIIFGPALWTQNDNDDSWSFPAVRDAIEDGDWQRAQEELDIVAKVLDQSAALFLEETTDVGN